VAVKLGISSHLRLVRLFPLGLFLCGVLATILLQNVLTERDRDQLEARTEAEARHVSAQVRVGILQAFDPLSRIGEWWLLQGRPLTPEDWESDAGLFMPAGAGLRSVSWVKPNGNLSWTAKPGLNAKPDSFEQPGVELQKAVEMARRLDAVASGGIFEIDNRSLLYACAPIRRNGKAIGFVAGLYDAADLIRSVLAGQLPDDYAVTVTGGGREISTIATRNYSPSAAIAREIPLEVANTAWSIRIYPSAVDGGTMRRLVTAFGLLISILVYACAAMASTARRRAGELAAANQRLALENLERRRAEERVEELNRDLQRRLQEFPVLMEVLPIGIAVAVDPECRNIWTNPSMAAMLQVPLDQNISKSSQDAGKLTYRIEHNGVEVAPQDLPMQVAARTKAPVANQELDLFRHDGSVIHTLSYSAPVFDEAGAVRGVINACVDITERRRAEHEIVAQRRQLAHLGRVAVVGEMSGALAHELNQPLTAILANARAAQRMLVRDRVDVTELRAILDDIVADDLRAGAVIHRVRALIRKGDVGPQQVVANEIVSEVLELTHSDLIQREVRVATRLAASLPAVPGDRVQLQQVVLNLIVNACDAMADNPPSERTLSISTFDEGMAVRVSVSDRGTGIAGDSVDAVFEPFVTSKEHGVGLGLAICRSIVNAHGGRMWAVNNPDRGATFHLLLPQAQITTPADAALAAVESTTLAALQRTSFSGVI